MTEEICHADGRIEHPSVRTEKTDANFPWILGILLVALAVGALLFWLVLQFFYYCRAAEDKSSRSPFPLAPTPATTLPPQPRLEQLDRITRVESATVDVRQTREAILSSYGPTKDKGFVHIPIERAMALLANKLPDRSGAVVLQERLLVNVTALGLAAAPPGQGPFLAAGTFLHGKTARPRDRGLVDGGESNSGRLFQRRAQWHER